MKIDFVLLNSLSSSLTSSSLSSLSAGSMVLSPSTSSSLESTAVIEVAARRDAADLPTTVFFQD